MLHIDPEHLGEQLSGYLDGELSVKDTQIVEGWLRDHEEVREQLDALRQIVSGVQALPRHAPPPELVEDLLAQLERHDLLDDVESVRPIAPVRSFPWITSLSAAAIVGIVALVGVRQFGTSEADGTAASSRVADARTATSSVESASRDLNARVRDAKGPFDTDRKPLQSMLEAGTTAESVRVHAFAAEPVRLTVGMTRSNSATDAVDRIVTYLGDAKLLNVSIAQDRMLSATSDAFFLRGVRGVNFEDDESQQVLVRLPRAAIAELLDAVERETTGTNNVTLSAGPLQFDGLDNARQTLNRQSSQFATGTTDDPRSRRSMRRRRMNQSASRSVTTTNEDRTAVDDPGFADLLETLGVPNAALNVNERSRSTARAEPTADDAPHRLLKSESTAGTNSPETSKMAKAKSITNQPLAVSEGKGASNRPVTLPVDMAALTDEPGRFITLILDFREPPATNAPRQRPNDAAGRGGKDHQTTRPPARQSK